MKASTAYAMTWIATAVVVSVAILVTKSAFPLWGMVIPLCINMSSED